MGLSLITQKQKMNYENRSDKVARVKLTGIVTTNDRVTKAYYKKAISYGDYWDVMEYNEAQIFIKKKREDYTKKMKTERRQDSIYRARMAIYRIIECNIGKWGSYPPIFFTLTFEENITDVKQANAQFKLFLQRLKYRLGIKLAYLVVPEFQKRGAVHYHGVFFNLPKVSVSEFEQIWGLGFTRIEKTKKIKNIAAYVAKYLTKESFDSRLYGERSYFTSRGLWRPIEHIDHHHIDRVLGYGMFELVGVRDYDKVTLFKYKRK